MLIALVSISFLIDLFSKLSFSSRSYSTQDECNIIGSARGVMNYYGGKLSCPLTGL